MARMEIGKRLHNAAGVTGKLFYAGISLLHNKRPKLNLHGGLIFCDLFVLGF